MFIAHLGASWRVIKKIAAFLEGGDKRFETKSKRNSAADYINPKFLNFLAPPRLPRKGKKRTNPKADSLTRSSLTQWSHVLAITSPFPITTTPFSEIVKPRFRSCSRLTPIWQPGGTL